MTCPGAGLVMMLVMVPNAADPKLVFGTLKLEWFSELNSSAELNPNPV
jgi:hypothetical protein